MAIATETYANWAEREAWVAQYETQGWRMLHDDFDSDWKRGDEPHGTLTFTDEPAPVAPSLEPVFDPPSGTGTPKRLTYIEEFLAKLYPGEEI